VDYNSDIYFGSRAEPVPDYTFTASPKVNIYLPLWKGVVVDLAENPRYIYYLHTKNDRALDNAFRGQLHVALKRWYFQGGARLVNAQERLSTELNLNIGRKETDFAGQAFWQISEGSAIALQYRSFDYIYENPQDANIDIATNLDRKEQFVNLTTYLKQTSKWRFYVDAQYGTYDFKQAISNDKNSRSYALYTGMEFSPPPTGEESTRGFWGKIDLGYQRIDIRDPRRKDYGGLAGNSSVVLTLSNAFSAHGVFSRAIQFSVYSDLDYYIQTVYGVGITRSLTRNLRIYGDIAFSRNDYALPSGSLSSEPRLDRYATYSLGLRLRLEKDLEMSLNASFGTRSSNLAEQPRSKDLILGFTLTYGYAPIGTGLLTNAFSR
jgi:hypothetical protein